jgi:hypothetical protein
MSSTIRNNRRARHKLVDIEVEEVSLVDKPANNRRFAVIKNEGGEVVERDGDVLIIDRSVSSAAAAAAAAGSRFGAVFGALADVHKALDVNETARDVVNSSVGQVFWQLDRLYDLMNDVEGTYTEGSLDQAIGSELNALAGALMAMAGEFGVVQTPAPAPLEKGDTDVVKAGAKMAKGNAALFSRGMAALHELAESVLGDDDMAKMCGGRRFAKSADDATADDTGIDVETELQGIDEGLAAALILVKAHSERIAELEAKIAANQPTEIVKARQPRRVIAPASNAITTTEVAKGDQPSSGLMFGTDTEIIKR